MRKHTCSICKQEGHNIRNCPNKQQQPKKQKKNGKIKKHKNNLPALLKNYRNAHNALIEHMAHEKALQKLREMLNKAEK